MTDKEKAIVMAFTGACMLTGDKFRIFHEYIENIMGKPIYTHELISLRDEIKEKSRADFIKICEGEKIEDDLNLPPVTPQPKTGHWEHGKEISREYRGQTLVNINYLDWHCSNCHCVVEQSIKPEWNYCPACGAKMIEPQESEDKCKNCEYFHNPDYTRCHECNAGK